jgi:hypothetical protein
MCLLYANNSFICKDLALDRGGAPDYTESVRTFTTFTFISNLYHMDSAIESVRKRYQITVEYKHIGEGEAEMKKEAIVGALPRLLRHKQPAQQVDKEGV